ncbi:MAG: UDP-N-acetylmuramoyl-L-alanine--D-glutamate ligase [Burkholderiales bacterium]
MADPRGKRILVLGLGATGLSMARWLRAHGARVSLADSRTAPPNVDAVRREFPEMPLDTGPFRCESFAGIDVLAVSPGVPLAEPEIRRAMGSGVPAVGDIELFGWGLDLLCGTLGVSRPALIGITGSNGKSTVTEMAGELCRSAGLETLVAGNIGLPVLDALGEIERGTRPLPRAVVLELSSFQLETTATLALDAATVLNLSEDHLDRYPGMREYGEAKARIFHHAAVQIVNRDDPATLSMVRSGAPVWTFGLDSEAAERAWSLRDVDGEEWLCEGRETILRTRELRVAGKHNAANALAALALARAIGLPYPALAQALRTFRGLPHRVEFVDEIDGRRFYDDSKGTNVGATVAALTGMREPVVLIAGGDGKGQDFSPLGPAAARHARAVILIGRDRELIGAALSPHGVKLDRATDMHDAVNRAFDVSERDDAVLLSPACASFDMFRNYEHRADVFRDAVARLRERRACSA